LKMLETQFEILKKVEELYSEIARITTLIDLEQDDTAGKFIIQRENLFNEIVALKRKQENLPLGASQEQIDEIDEKIKSLILSIMADSASLIEKAKALHASMKEEISKLSTANKAAQSYAVYKR